MTKNCKRKGVIIDELTYEGSSKPKDFCCVCKSKHDTVIWKKGSFTLTPLALKMASLMKNCVIDGNLCGNVCCNAAKQLSKREQRKTSQLNVNDPKFCELDIEIVLKCFPEIKPASFILETILQEQNEYPLDVRYMVALAVAKYDVGTQNIYDIVKLVGNLPEFGNLKLRDAMNSDTVIRCIVEIGLCVKVALSLILSESLDLLWSCDETEDHYRRFLAITAHGMLKDKPWHFVLGLSEISDHASVNIGCKSGILTQFNNQRRLDYKETDPYGVTVLEDCIFLSCADHTVALAAKRAHKQMAEICKEFKVYDPTKIPPCYLSIIHYITSVISSKFRTTSKNKYLAFENEIRYCSVDIVANLIVERLYFFKSIRRYITDKKLYEVLMLLDRKEIVMMLCVSSCMWTSLYSKYMKSGSIISSSSYYLEYLEKLTAIISNPNNYSYILNVTFEITPELFREYYNSTKSLTLNIPSLISGQIEYENNILPLNQFEEQIGKSLVQNRAIEQDKVAVLILEESSEDNIEHVDISCIGNVQENLFMRFGEAIISGNVTSLVDYITKNNYATEKLYSDFITATNRLCERTFSTNQSTGNRVNNISQAISIRLECQ
ncbi:predicted protein [Naegleria gruberi]|uniref:Predicted protein n=1 Tax=Naegleria gruberi TaxID=5762 RepID=D2VVV7_NAEGR|nr:uncharacterized protein NAEGRDRAFT_73156 [Naegleria gruberi]EFC39110.1 predicted protein [Naegleria gruberi]|eukprot:XP_002671854.1 predicted protein [Naegleria gruberi strain NEG-M]